MELELKKCSFNYFDVIFDACAAHEETLEAIVPDACPDILRIVETEGMAFLRSCETMDGRAELGGTVRACVLYVPENERGVRKIDVSIPFSHTFDIEGASPKSRILARASIQTIEARTVNPRKLVVRVGICVCATVYNPCVLEMCTDIADGCEAEMQKTKRSAYMPVAIKEKSFTIVDELEIPSSKPPASEILKTTVRLVTNDAKIIGSKVVFKGTAMIKTLYFAGGGASILDDICVIENELPFSQIVEVDSLDEEAECRIDLSLTGIEMSVRADMAAESRALSVSLTLEAQAIAGIVREFETISDIYSTSCEMEAEMRPYNLKSIIEKSVRRNTVREVIDVQEPCKQVIDMNARLGPAVQRREQARIFFDCDCEVTVIYFGEDDMVYNASRRFTVSYAVEAPENAVIMARVSISNESFSSASASGIEVRFSVDYDIECSLAERVMAVSAVKSDGGIKDVSGRPSVVMRFLSERECLWDVAKRYGTTVKDILTANGLEDEASAHPGRLLLIPKKR